MTGMSPLCSTSFGNISSPRLFACSFSMRFRTRLRSSGGRPAISSSADSARYHSSRVFSWLNSAIDSR